MPLEDGTKKSALDFSGALKDNSTDYNFSTLDKNVKRQKGVFGSIFTKLVMFL